MSFQLFIVTLQPRLITEHLILKLRTMTKWKIDFIDKWTHGNVKTIYRTSNESEQEVIEELELDSPEVEWYKITKVNE